MSWVKTYQPNEKEIDKIYKGYRATLTEQREKARKSNKLTRKDYTNLYYKLRSVKYEKIKR